MKPPKKSAELGAQWQKLTGSGRGPDCPYHASLTITRRGMGTLCITKSGVAYMRELRSRLKSGDRVEVFIDDETDQIGLLKSNQGEFTMSASRGGGMRINSKLLASRLPRPARFRLESSVSFDLYLLPITK